MLIKKMDAIYAGLKDAGFELSAASYEKDEYHIFYKSGLVLTVDLSTDDAEATMMYFDTNHEFVSYSYKLDSDTAFDDMLEHVLNVISTNSMLLKWNLTLYEIMHLDKLMFLSKRDLAKLTTNRNMSSIKADRIMNFDKDLFDMLLGSGNEKNQITLLYNKLSKKNFRLVLVEKTNTGLSNITRALFLKEGMLITLFYEESGIVLCGDVFFQTKEKIKDNLYITDDDIISESHLTYLYKLKLSEALLTDVLYMMDKTDIFYDHMVNDCYKDINLSSSVEYLTSKYSDNLSAIKNELSSHERSILGIE